MKNPTAGYDVGENTGGQLTVTASEDGAYIVTVKEDSYKTGYENGEVTIKVNIEAETSDGYKVTISKNVTIAEHTGGTATCMDKAVCDICHQEYGEPDINNHATTPKHIEAKNATTKTAGNTEYWYCTACDKYFADEACTIEITQADTVVDKLSADSDQSSQTGDEFNMTLLMVLLIASCGGFAATIFYRRRHVK